MKEPDRLISPDLKGATKRLVTVAQQLLQVEKSVKSLGLSDDMMDQIYIDKTASVKQAALEFIEILEEDENG